MILITLLAIGVWAFAGYLYGYQKGKKQGYLQAFRDIKAEIVNHETH